MLRESSLGLKYLLTYHLGSVVAVTNASGALLSQQRYLPFGQVRTDIGTVSETDFGYTGQRALGDLGLMDYHARFYDASLGRFIQPDTVIPDAADPQTWDRYSYVYNNPIDLTDPTGNFGHCRNRIGCKRFYNKISNLEKKWHNEKVAADAKAKALQDVYYATVRNTTSELERQDEYYTAARTADAQIGGGGGLTGDNWWDTEDYGFKTDPTQITQNQQSQSSNTNIISTGSPNKSGPNWEKIGEGAGLFVLIFLTIDLPLAAGTAAFWEAGAIEGAMLVTEPGWVIPLAAALLSIHVYAINLIVEGVKGQ